MKRASKLGIFLVLFVLLLLVVSSAGVQAQNGGGYDLTWWTIDGGGDSVSNEGNGYTLIATFGQPDVGPALVGGDYGLFGGFWPSAGPDRSKVFLPLVLADK